MEGVGGRGLMGLPEAMHRLICAFFINGHNEDERVETDPLFRESNHDWLPVASVSHALRRMYLGWRTDLYVKGRRTSVASLLRLRSAMVSLRSLRVAFEAPALGVVREALLQGGWEGVQALFLCEADVEIDPADHASGFLPLEHLPGLRSLETISAFPNASYAMSMLTARVCPLLDSLYCITLSVEDGDVSTLTALLNARSAAKCSPLRRFHLELEQSGAWDEEEVTERVEGLRELLLSPSLASLEVFGLSLIPDTCVLLHRDDLAILGEYLGRLGRGQLKEFSMPSMGDQAWPDSFLTAVHGGALCGLVKLDDFGGEAQCAALVQPLVEGGGCPRVTEFRSRELCWLLEGALVGAFPALKQLTSYWYPERLRVLSQCLIGGKLPCLVELEIRQYHPQEEAALYEGLAAFMGAAEHGALHKLTRLHLYGSAWSVRILTLLVNALEEGHLPALKHLEFNRYGTPMAEEVVQVLGDAMGRGCFRGVEQLQLNGCIGGAGSMAHIVRGLRGGNLDKLLMFSMYQDSAKTDRPLLIELLSLIERARFPRLHVLELGSSVTGGAYRLAIAQLRAREGMSWLTVR